MATCTYNGVVMAVIGKISFSRNDTALRVNFAFERTASNLESVSNTLRRENQTFSISAGAWTASWAMGSNALAVRPTYSKPGSPYDGENLKVCQFSVEIDLPTTWPDGFQTWRADMATDERGVMRLSVSGRVTSVTNAVSVYNAGIATIVGVVTGLYPTVFWEEPRHTLLTNRTNTEANFSYEQQQRLEEYTTSGSYDDTIVLARWDVQQIPTLLRGNADTQNTYRASWTARFPIAKGQTATVEQWKAGIFLLITEKLRSLFATDTKLVLQEESFDYSPTSYEASGSFTVLAAADTISYLETVSIQVEALQFRKLMDGLSFSGIIWTYGCTGIASQHVTWRRRSLVPTAPPPPSISTVGGIPITLEPKSIGTSNYQQFAGASEYQGTDLTTDYQLDWRADFWIVRSSPSKYANPGHDGAAAPPPGAGAGAPAGPPQTQGSAYRSGAAQKGGALN